jgi:hypothetical protein
MLFIIEVYNPKEYRNYIRLGKMDYLYDKVETYDKLRMSFKSSPDGLSAIQNGLADIEHHMLHFLTIMMSSDWQVQNLQERHKREAVNGGIYNH